MKTHPWLFGGLFVYGAAVAAVGLARRSLERLFEDPLELGVGWPLDVTSVGVPERMGSVVDQDIEQVIRSIEVTGSRGQGIVAEQCWKSAYSASGGEVVLDARHPPVRPGVVIPAKEGEDTELGDEDCAKLEASGLMDAMDKCWPSVESQTQ